MDILCKFIQDNINNDYDIGYYVRQSSGELISYDILNYNDTIEYICDNLHYYFNKYNYDIIINEEIPNVSFIINKRKCSIHKQYHNYSNILYWVLYIERL